MNTSPVYPSLPSFLTSIRRNHALEHATIHILSRRYPGTSLIGRSDSRGFYLFGDVPTNAVREAVAEALQRLRAGEVELAVHPNCGTNLVITALMAGGVSYFSLLGDRQERWYQRLSRLPLAIGATILALITAPKIGRAAQQHLTTLGDPGAMEVIHIERRTVGNSTLHRTITRA